MNRSMESRKHARYRCEHPLWIKPYAIVDGEYQLAEVHNISVGGAYFTCMGPVRIDQVMELCIELPQQWRLLPMRGYIRHIEERGNLVHCGMAFQNVPDMVDPQIFSEMKAMPMETVSA